MKFAPTTLQRPAFMFLIVSMFVLFACNFLSPPSSSGRESEAGVTPGAGKRSTPTPTPTGGGLSLPDGEYTLDLEAYGQATSNGVTMTTGPFTVSIPLERDSEGLVGYAKVLVKETVTGGCDGERTVEDVLDVVATGQGTLTITITWTMTVLSGTGECYGKIPPPSSLVSDPFELPARDGATTKIDYPSEVGDYYEIYTLHIK